MNTRSYWAVALVAAVLCYTPEQADARRIPSKPAVTDNSVVSDSDPWIPDGRDPGRALQQDFVEVSVEGRDSVDRQPVRRENWYRYVLRVLRSWAVRGMLR